MLRRPERPQPNYRWPGRDTFLKERPERAVECARPGLQQRVRAAFRPLHLLTFGKTFADDGVHGGLRQARGDALTGAESFAIVDHASDVGSDIDGEFVRCAAKFPRVEVVHLKIADVDQERLNDGTGCHATGTT